MKKILFLSMTTLFLFSSCLDDILDKKPLDMITDAVVWEDPVLIDAFLTTQYSYTSVFVNDATTVFDGWDQNPVNSSTDWTFNMGNSSQADGPFLSGDVSDEAMTLGAGLYNASNFKIYGVTINGGLMEYWENPYKIIRNLNEFIEKVPDSPIEKNQATLRIAEARFLRAFNYFAMVKRYGGVPLITKAQKMSDPVEELYPSRNTEKEIYDFIITEMEEIATDLEKTVDYGRPSKWAALALKCRAALYAGSIAQFGTVQLNGLLGFPKDQANVYYQKAYDAADDIIKNSGHSLYNQDADKVTNFRNIFLKKRNSEAIFAKQHDGVDAVQSGGNAWSWDYMQCPKPHAENGGNRSMPYLELVEEFEYVDGRPGKFDRAALQQGLWTLDDLWGGKDPRFFASIWTNGTAWQGTIVDNHKGLITPSGELLTESTGVYEGVYVWGNQNLWYNMDTGFGIMKYLNESTSNVEWFSRSSTDYLVFRYGEILLNFAEAAFELGKADEALSAINKIRDRAGIPNLSTVDREKIRHERLVELAFENHRYWDLRRWREAKKYLSRQLTGLRYILDYTTRKFRLEVVDLHGSVNVPNFKEENYYFPIGLGRTNANANLLENPGYQ